MDKENKSYTNLEVWQFARKLVSAVYSASQIFLKDELLGLTNQLRRAAVSIPSNIAEGCGRQTPRDTINFLFIARGSLYELETQIYVALDLNYLPAETAEDLFILVTSCKKLLHGFINHYRQQLA